MGKIGKIVGSGIAFTSEAIHAYKASKVKKRGENSDESTFSIVLDSNVLHNYGCPFGGNSEIDPLINSKKSDSAKSLKNERRGLCRDTRVYLGEESDRRGPYGCDCAVDIEDEDSDLDEGIERPRAPSFTEWPPATGSIAKPKGKKKEGRVQRLIRMADPIPKALPKESCTVIIPQRRPGNKYRGFVRAYAPVLEDFGITQDIFFQFLKDFDNVNRACRVVNVMYIVGAMIGCLPELTCQFVNIVVLFATKAAKEIQGRYRRNRFLDRANQELFMPRGLFAMVMSFKDEPPEDGQHKELNFITKVSTGINKIRVSGERLDIEEALFKYSNPDPGLSKFQKAKTRLRSVHGETTGLLSLPDSAPLVYQYSDPATMKARAGKRKGIPVIQNVKSAGQWVRDYFDRKAQAEYGTGREGSPMAVPPSHREPLISPFNAPDHPATTGSLVELLTHGKLSSKALRDSMRLGRRRNRETRKQWRDSLDVEETSVDMLTEKLSNQSEQRENSEDRTRFSVGSKPDRKPVRKNVLYHGT